MTKDELKLLLIVLERAYHDIDWTDTYIAPTGARIDLLMAIDRIKTKLLE